MAATAVGADMIRRPDLGRLAPGCKADFSVVDMSNPYMQPDYEPIRSLVYSANDRAIKDVYVDGRQVVRDGEVLATSTSPRISRCCAEARRRPSRPLRSATGPGAGSRNCSLAYFLFAGEWVYEVEDGFASSTR